MNRLSRENVRKLRPDRPFHLSSGAQPIRSTVTLHLEGMAQQPIIVLNDTRRSYVWRVAMQRVGDMRWEASVRLPMEPTIVTYFFRDSESDNAYELFDLRQVEGGNKPVYGEWTELPFKIAVYDPKRMPAEWTQGMLLYQIFPDRFASSDIDRPLEHPGVYGHEALFKRWGEVPEAPPLGRDFFGGDLRGIIQRLDYLQDLGVECIYLNPIFEASTNHRYEAINFLKIDPMLGTDEDFDTLIRETGKRGIKVILDAVFNHCSTDSIYFDITGKYEQEDGIVGASQAIDSPYYRWFNFHQWPTDYDGWLGFGFMPEFVESPEMEEYFIGGSSSITGYWLERGIDGWRCDVADDNSDSFWRRFRKCVDEVKPGAYLIAEEWRDSSHYLLGDTYSATMNYRFAWAVRGLLATDSLTPSVLDDRLQMWMLDTPAPALKSQMNLLDTHDTDRLMTACAEDRRRFKQAVAFLLAYIGAPSIYYGTEVGLEGAYAEDGRRTMPWDHIDAELHAFVKHAATTRGQSDVLRLGDVETVVIDDSQRAYGFVRRRNGQAVYALFNASDRTATLEFPAEDGPYRDLLGLRPEVRVSRGTFRVELPARETAWFTRD